MKKKDWINVAILVGVFLVGYIEGIMYMVATA